MSYIYILKSSHFQKTYTGSTVDLEKRISEHNAGWNTFSKRYAPWILVYSEEYATISGARKREKYLKSSAGRKFIKVSNIIPR